MIRDVEETINNFFDELKVKLYTENRFDEADAIDDMLYKLLGKIDVDGIEEMCQHNFNEGYKEGESSSYDDGYDSGYAARKSEE